MPPKYTISPKELQAQTPPPQEFSMKGIGKGIREGKILIVQREKRHKRGR